MPSARSIVGSSYLFYCAFVLCFVIGYVINLEKQMKEYIIIIQVHPGAVVVTVHAVGQFIITAVESNARQR